MNAAIAQVFDFVIQLVVKNLVRISTNLDDEDIKNFHTNMWIFCHGIATLVANNTIFLTDNQIEQMLSYEFQALMLLKENPDNKWVLRREDYEKEII